MARKRKKAAEPLPAIWNVDDQLWAKAEAVLEELGPPARFGPKRIDQRKAGTTPTDPACACSDSH